MKKLPIIFTLSIITLISHADTKDDPLSRFLADFNTLQANFTQTLINETGEQLEKTEGILYLNQPGKFHWSYQSPYKQQIISDGELLWVYDEDLEQVTIRLMGSSIDQTPAGIILGNNNIDEHFVQVDLGKIEGFDWIELTPRDLEATYKNIRFGFDDTKLGMMIIADNLGQTTRIDFNDVNKNKNLSTDLFTFEVPSDIDVIDERDISDVAQ